VAESHLAKYPAHDICAPSKVLVDYSKSSWQ
jgi:hypothetical protein